MRQFFPVLGYAVLLLASIGGRGNADPLSGALPQPSTDQIARALSLGDRLQAQTATVYGPPGSLPLPIPPAYRTPLHLDHGYGLGPGYRYEHCLGRPWSRHCYLYDYPAPYVDPPSHYGSVPGPGFRWLPPLRHHH